MFDTRTILLSTVLLGISLAQHSILLGTMHDIPAKIHYEIFGGNSRRPLPMIVLSNLNAKPYIATPLQAQKRSLSGGLTYNSIAYGFGSYQTPLNNSKQVDRIPLATELFAPAIIKFPAATKGQVEAYMKALEEEAKETSKGMQMMMGTNTEKVDNMEQRIMDTKAVSYVNVKLGGRQNVNYQYSTL